MLNHATVITPLHEVCQAENEPIVSVENNGTLTCLIQMYFSKMTNDDIHSTIPDT
jgi:hypothetical protein